MEQIAATAIHSVSLRKDLSNVRIHFNFRPVLVNT